MKKIILLGFMMICLSGLNAQVTKPESIIWNELTGNYIVSDTYTGKLVSMEKDGYFSDFTTGLNNPKGLVSDGFSIWVTDLRDLVEIDAESGDILNTYTIPGAGSLNDITIDDWGYLYISDMQGNKIYRFDTFSSESEVFSAGLVPAPNGIYYDIFGGLIVVSFGDNGGIYSVDLEEGNVELIKLTQLGMLDGIAYDSKRDRFYISSWATNSIYIFDPSFEDAPQLLRSGLNGPADIYYDALTDTLVVPVMNTGEIVFIGFEKETIEILGNDVVCENSEQVYKVDFKQDKSYLWSVTGGQISGTNDADTLVVLWETEGTGKIKIVQTDLQTSEMDSAEMFVQIARLPVVNILGENNVCEESAAFYFSQNQSGYTNQWFIDKGEFLSGTNSNTITVLWSSIEEEMDSSIVFGSIKLIQTDNITGCTNSQTFQINITKKPEAEILGDISVCVGDYVNYVAKTEENSSYKWITETGEIEDTLVTLLFGQPGEKTLILIQTNSLGCTDTAMIQITANPLPEIPVITLDGTTLVSTEAETYQWYYEGNFIDGANQQSFIPVDSGSYQVLISDVNGCKSISKEFLYSPLSVTNNGNLNDEYNIFPVPVNDKLFFTQKNPAQIKLKIYNILGVILETIILTEKNVEIDTSKLNSGLYFLNIENGKTNHVIKFIKE